MNIVIENVDLVIGSVIAFVTALGGAVVVWQGILSKKKESTHTDDDCLSIARAAKEQITLLEQKVNGEQNIRLNRVESDIDQLFDKVDKTLDLIIAQLERNSNAS